MKKIVSLAVLLSLTATSRTWAANPPASMPASVQIFTSAFKLEKTTWLGLSTVHPEEILLKQLKLKSGLVVAAVEPASPAEQAGVKADDLVTKLDDQMLINPEQFRDLIRMHEAGQSITLTLMREGQEMKVTAKLIEHDSQAAALDSVATQLEAAISSLPNNGKMQSRILINRDDQEQALVVKPDMTFNTNLVYRDHAHTFITSTLDGKKQLLVIDESGKQLFFGSVDTKEAAAKIPADLQDGYKGMLDMEGKVGTAQMSSPEK